MLDAKALAVAFGVTYAFIAAVTYGVYGSFVGGFGIVSYMNIIQRAAPLTIVLLCLIDGLIEGFLVATVYNMFLKTPKVKKRRR